MRRLLPILLLAAAVGALVWGASRYTDQQITVGGGVELTKAESPRLPELLRIDRLDTSEDPIGGRVLSPAGRPVFDARVEVFLQEGTNWLDAVSGRPLAVLKTGADGLFSLSKAEPGSYVIRARAEGLWEGIAILPRFKEGQARRVTVCLPALVSIRGRVEDRHGRPVVGAKVLVGPAMVITGFLRRATEFKGIRLPKPVLVVTDANGAFLAKDLAPTTVDLSVEAPGMVTADVYTVTPPRKDLLIRMMNGITVTGTVTWGEEQAPESIRVFSEPEGIAAVVEIRKTAATFEFTGLPPGDHVIHAWGRGFGAASGDLHLLPEEKPPQVDLELVRGTRVTGLVSELYSGRPITPARVTLSQITKSRGEITVVDRETFETGPDGVYRFHPPPGRWVVRAEAADHVPTETVRFRSRPRYAGRAFDITSGEVEVRRDLVLQGNYIIRGRVVYPDGSPARAVVRTSGAEFLEGETNRKRRIPRGQVARTDSAGYFQIEGVAPFAIYEVAASWGKNNLDVVEGVTFKAGSRRTAAPVLTIRAPPPRDPEREPELLEIKSPIFAVATGRIVNQRAKPVPSALLSVSGRLVHTDDKGRFRVPDLEEGSYGVRAIAPSYPPASLGKFRLKKGVDKDVGDFVLPDRGVRVMGSVYTADHTPVPDVRLRVHFSGQNEPYTLFTDTHGRYEIEGPAAKSTSVTIEARPPGYGVVSLSEGVVDTRVIDLELRSMVPLTIRIDGGQTPLPTLTLQITPWSGAHITSGFTRKMSPTGRGGVWVVRGIQAGTYEIVLTAAGYAPLDLGRQQLSKASGHDLGRHRLSRGGTVVGVVTDREQNPVAGATVSLFSSGVRTGHTPKMITAADGKFTFEHVPVGNQRFTAHGPERRVRPLSGSGMTKVREGKTAKIKIRLR